MATNTSKLHIRLNSETKVHATQALADMGRSVADQAFPLELKVPNAETRAAMQESRALMAARRARFANADERIAQLENDSG